MIIQHAWTPALSSPPLKQIMALGVMLTPALAINGTVKVVGKVPSVAEIKTLLQQAAA